MLHFRHISVALARYLRWLVFLSNRSCCHCLWNCRLGVKTRIFHLGDYRRATIPVGQDIPDDYFFVNGESFVILYRFRLCPPCYRARSTLHSHQWILIPLTSFRPANWIQHPHHRFYWGKRSWKDVVKTYTSTWISKMAKLRYMMLSIL